jgi:uncharacterized protein (DUF58 family)
VRYKSENSWISHNTIEQVERLAWVARKLSAGLIHGRHKSQRLAQGMEFSQYRAYVPGDDPRLLDWKMLAKTDKYFVRQSQIEKDHKMHLLLDNSKSMLYSEDSTSKLDIAVITVACITHILSQQGDTFGWQSYDLELPLKSGYKHWNKSIELLSKLKGEEKQNFLVHDIKKNSTVVWITDLYDTPEQIDKFVSALKNPTTELIVYHLLGIKEEHLDFPSNTTFIDLESGEKMEVNAPKFKGKYQTALGQHFYTLKNLFYKKGIIYHRTYLHHPVENQLRDFFEKYDAIKIA